jgi:flagellar M-ring protein FliF
LRSEQSLEETRVGGDTVAGIPGALSNRPPGVGAAPETAATAEEDEAPPPGPGQTRVQATRNYEVDRTISHTRHQVGRIARLAVSVVLDEARPGAGAGADGAGGADGEAQQPAWTDEELARIEALVKTAVGFSEARGDIVTVASSRFFVGEAEPMEPAPFWMETWFLELSKQILGAVIVLLIVVVLLRPLFRNLSKTGDIIKTQQNLAGGAQGAGTAPALGATGGGALPGPQEDQKLESVRSLVAQNPESVARVVKQWTLANE